jgi:DnaK suppressor protein
MMLLSILRGFGFPSKAADKPDSPPEINQEADSAASRGITVGSAKNKPSRSSGSDRRHAVKAATRKTVSPAPAAKAPARQGSAKAAVPVKKDVVSKPKPGKVAAKAAPVKAAAKPSPKAAVTKVNTKATPKVAPKGAAKAPAAKVAKAVTKVSAAKTPVAKKAAVSKPAAKPAAKAVAKPVATPKKVAAAATKAVAAKPAAKPTEKPAAKAKATSVVKPVAAKASSAPAVAKPVAAKSAPVQSPASSLPKVGATIDTPAPMGKRAARKVMMEQMSQPEVLPTHSPDAAKATFSGANERVVNMPTAQASALKKDPKRADNWKKLNLEELIDADILAMSESEYMNDVQLAYFRRKLSLLRADMLANAGETTEHLREDTVVVPDPADRATIEEEHALELRTRDRERKLLKKIEQSLSRIDANDYGYCDETGEAIGVARLLARPTANLSLEAQQRRELKQKMFGD